MKVLLTLLFGFLFIHNVVSQPDISGKLLRRYDFNTGFHTVVDVRIDVPGITAPVKTIDVYYKKGEDPVIKGAGLVLLPKKGFIEQFSEILNIQAHWILLESNDQFSTYKLVSLDPKSDWVTADLKILLKDPRIEQILLTTRESGVFLITYTYSGGKFPVQTVVEFETEKFAIPLKFMGKQDSDKIQDKNGKVKGKIFMNFKKFETF